MQSCIVRDDEEVELSIRIHAVRKVKPFVSLFQAPLSSNDSRGSVVQSSLLIENACILAFCDFKRARNTHVSSILPKKQGPRSSKDGMSTARWSSPSSRRAPINGGEVVWSESGGTLKWKITRLGLRHHKSFCPKIKFELFALVQAFPSCATSTLKSFDDLDSVISKDTVAANTIGSTSDNWARQTIKPLGWVVLDIRDFENTLPEKTFRVNGGYSIGSEVTLTLTCLPIPVDFEPNKLNDKNATDKTHGGVTPFLFDVEWTGSTIPLGLGNAIFSLTIRLESTSCFHVLGVDPVEVDGWLSYSLFERVVQTEKFSLTTYPSFSPIKDTFRIRCSHEEIQSYIGEHCLLKIYICTSNDSLAGYAAMDLRPLIVGMMEDRKSEVHGKYFVEAINKSIDAPFTWREQPWIKASAVLQLVSCEKACSNYEALMSEYINDFGQRHANMECVEGETDSSSQALNLHSVQSNSELLQEKLVKLQDECVYHVLGGEHTVGQKIMPRAVIQDKEFSSSEVAMNIKKKHLEWETWRHKQEMQWHEKLRSKEDAVMKKLEDRARVKEKETGDAVESCRLEYNKLEVKLKKALSDVERRENQLVLHEAVRQEEFSRKVAELDSKHRTVLEEAKYSSNFQKAIGDAAIERAILGEKKALTAENKLQKVLKEMERLHEKMRESPEATLMQEITKLQGQLAESESRVDRERAECKHALLEKEQHKTQLHRLTKVLKREQDRSGAHKRKEIEQLRLEFMGREERLQLDGDRAELQRIKNELRALNFVPTESSSPRQVKPQSSVRQTHLDRHPTERETSLYSSEPFSTHHTQSSSLHTSGTDAIITNRSKSEDLQRLTQERADLLATGVFGEIHPVIVELNTVISELKTYTLQDLSPFKEN